MILHRATLLTPEVSKMIYFLEKMTFFANFISSEPLITWSRAAPNFNQKTQVMGGNCTEAKHFQFQYHKLLKMSAFDLQWS